MSNLVLTGSALSRLRELDSNSVQCIVTSPPYYGLRSYNAGDEEIGQEPTLQEFLSNLVEVFRECRRVLRKDGVCWVNMGDSYASRLRQSGPEHAGAITQGSNGTLTEIVRPLPTGFKEKDRMMVPARLAIALQDDGWWLRDEIVWHKPNPMPSSVQDRTTPAHEMIYLLTKSSKYFYDAAAIAELSVSPEYDKLQRHAGRMNGTPYMLEGKGQAKMGDKFGRADETRNCRSVWTFSTQGYPEAHFATYPEELPKRCILAGSREGDVVLDPFGGSGTTGAVAKQLGRKFVLIELNPEYVGLIEKRLASVTPSLFAGDSL